MFARSQAGGNAEAKLVWQDYLDRGRAPKINQIKLMRKMKHYWNTFLFSFKLDKRFGYAVLADVLFWLLMTALFLSFASLLESQGQALKGGVTSTEQLQQMLLSSSEKAGQFLGELKWFMGILVGGLIILVLAFLFLYSLKQSFIWSQILHKEFVHQKYWRWNLLHLVAPFLIAVFVLLGLLVRMLFSLTKNQVMGGVGVLVVVTLYYLFYSLWAKNFTHHYKVFESLGHTFSEWKEKGKSLWAAWFFASAVIFLLFGLIYLLNWQFIVGKNTNLLINMAIWALFLNWLSFYAAKATEHEHEHHHGFV